MSNLATVYNVMIASPSDVQAERNIVREVVNEWNYIHAANQHVVLLPKGWETHSAPIMGDRPQAILNKQVLADCDLLVAIFWTRIGTPTGVAASGTVEEIQEHIKAGKPASIYFSNAPVQPDSVDSEQYAQLKEFREFCKKRGLIETFDSPDEFRRKFTRQLAKITSEHLHFVKNNAKAGSGQTEKAVEPPEAKCKRNLDELISRVSNGKFHKVTLQRGTFVLSLLPRTVSTPLPLFGTKTQLALNTALEPLATSGWSHYISGDRYATYTSNRPDKIVDSATELTVEGRLAAVSHDVMNFSGEYFALTGRKVPEGVVNIPSVHFERHVIWGVFRYLKCLKELGTAGPWYLVAAAINLKKSILHPNAKHQFMFQGRAFEDEEIRPPLVEVPEDITSENEQTFARALRPIFDYIWREHGYNHCYNYTNNGDWAE